MTSSAINMFARSSRRAGFTLVELLVGLVIGSMILTGVLTTHLLLIRSGARTGYYTTMEAETRLAFEQLGVDARMSNNIVSTFTNGAITSVSLTMPNSTLSSYTTAVYLYDTSNTTNQKLIVVYKNALGTEISRKILISYIESLTFLRYSNTNGIYAVVPATTVVDTGVKHIQISVKVSRAAGKVATATQVIRSSAFTLRNIN